MFNNFFRATTKRIEFIINTFQMENRNPNLAPSNSKFKETSLFLLDILYNAVIIITLVVLIRTFLASPFRVVGESMADTLENKEFILVDKLSYIVGDIDRGDPIVFLPPIGGGDQPKFEQTGQADHKGVLKVEIDKLVTQKQGNYCQNTPLKHLWQCETSPNENDLIYYMPDQNKGGEVSSEANWEQAKASILTPEEVKQGYFEVKVEPNANYKFRIYDSKGPEYYVKRVIGIPGDTVKIKGGLVYLKVAGKEDFVKIEEPFLNVDNAKKTNANNYDKSLKEKVFIVPAAHYFVMGDNREFSSDSRAWVEPITSEPSPFVPKQNISGKVFVVLWPLNHMRLIDSADL